MQKDHELENLLKESLPSTDWQTANFRRILRSCKACAKEFYPKRKWQLFCSNPCRYEWNAKEAEQAAKRTEEIVKQLELEVKNLRAENALLRSQLERS